MNILLTTLHSKYSHSSLALPSIASCCRDIPGAAVTIREYTINEPREHLLRQIVAEKADLLAFSCYIWNIEKTLKIIADIKKITPDALILLGGPEASFGTFELMGAHPAIDFIIRGEGEAPFRSLVAALSSRTDEKLPGVELGEIENLIFRDGRDISSGPQSKSYPPLDTIPSPFSAGLVDLNKPLTYYETSRGCPFSCAFCLSSVEGHVRSFSMERIKNDLKLLMQRGVPQIKLVDRTFNYDSSRANEIWRFILEHNRESHFHFEIAAELLGDESFEILRNVPPQTFRFEIGVQSGSAETLHRVNRTTDLGRLLYAIRRLRTETAVHLHLDLVAGLPGEDFTGFLDSLQTVANLNPHQIQIEPLKVLKGSPMRDIASRNDYSFSSTPPYTILRNPWLSFDDIGRVETISRLIDLFFNQGGFETSLQLLTRDVHFAELFDRMAATAIGQPITALSALKKYELFYRIASSCCPSYSVPLLAEALFYDYCRHELPRQGKLPNFISARASECSWPNIKELTRGMNLPSESRIKGFCFSFSRDFKCMPWKDSQTAITFAYISSPGKGLNITLT